eukprot:Rhum_TRINITY_DN4474_c0_g1::Rhum_TRINITY_DN4474_c0_g1_i1::g.14496::m.14496
MADVTAALKKQYDDAAVGRCVGWEDSLRRWRVRRQVKAYRAAVTLKNEAAKTKALDQYSKVSARFATAARNDPLHTTASQMKGAEVAAHKFVAADAYESGSKEATEFSWRDEDMAGDTVVIPEALRSKLAGGSGGGGGAAASAEAECGGGDAVLERAGDTRKKNIEEAKKKRAADVADRAAKRTKQMEELQEKSDRAVLSHDYTAHQKDLAKQSGEVQQQLDAAQKLQESSKDRFADILSDSD